MDNSVVDPSWCRVEALKSLDRGTEGFNSRWNFLQYNDVYNNVILAIYNKDLIFNW